MPGKYFLYGLLFYGLFFCIFVNGVAQEIKQTRITLRVKNESLKEVIKQVESRTPFTFLARAEDIENHPRISIEVTDQPLDEVLERICRKANLHFKQSGTNIILTHDNGVAGIKEKQKMQTFTVHGRIKSRKTGELIIGASVTVAGTSAGTTSNDYGFYSISLAPGKYTLQVSSVGMKAFATAFNLLHDQQIDIALEEDITALEEITVRAATKGRGLRTPQMSMESIELGQIKNMPVLFGERDVLKSLQLLPGVKAAGEGSSGFYVRGGAADQNLILLDEAPVYNAFHLLGFFSTFNSDAIKNVTLYKGAMPVQYGGRLSSVVDIKMNDGNNQQWDVSGGIGLIASRLNIEGPLQKNRSSFLLSGRRTYADLFLKLLGDSGLKKTQLYFYDFNAKMNVIAGEKDRLYLSAYFGRDVLSQDKFNGINWGNATATWRWNHIFSQKLFSNTSFIFSKYDYQITVNNESRSFRIFSQIKDWNLKEELQWFISSGSTLNLGLNSIYHTIKPGEISLLGNSTNNLPGLQNRYALEQAIHAGHNWKLSGKWNINYGIRLSAFTILGKGDYYRLDEEGKITDTLTYRSGQVVKTYLNPEPRLAIAYQLTPSAALKASYTRNTQNLHLVSNTTSSSPADKWVASTNIIKPEIGDQFAVGYYKDFSETPYHLTMECYYKPMRNQIDYRDGAQVFTNEPIETQLLFGKGRAYGIEWLLKKTDRRLTGWISYTLSKTERRIQGINNNRWYNARQDRTHDIAVTATYHLNKKWIVSANWIYYTGDAVTYPAGKYTMDGEVYFYYSERNGYRLPDYHRLDLGATMQLKNKKRFSSELSFSLFNAYGRANAWQISFRESVNDPQRTEAVQTSLFTFVPSITYNFKF